MAKRMTESGKATRAKVLHSAAVLFLEKGFKNTTIIDIARHADVNRGSVVFAISSKENLLNIIVDYVLDGQFEVSKGIIAGKTDDPVLYYAVECVLQLAMAEVNEQVRELYLEAYTMTLTSNQIYSKTTKRLIPLFKQYNPTWGEPDFYECEIASGSIIRGYIAKPCNIYFTFERKVNAYLHHSLALYHVPQEKVEEAIAFVSEIDFTPIAQNTIDSLLSYLEKRMTGEITEDINFNDERRIFGYQRKGET